MAQASKTNGPNYEVAFGKPPEHTRFKKGQSGNPKGRPKGKLNLTTVIERTLQEKVVINENAQRKTITKLEAAIRQLVNKAASGDLGALKQLAALVRAADQHSEQATLPQAALGAADRAVMQGVLRRLRSLLEESDHESDTG